MLVYSNLELVFYWFITLVSLVAFLSLLRTEELRFTWMTWGIILILLAGAAFSLYQCNKYLQMKFQVDLMGMLLITASLSLLIAFLLQLLIDREIIHKSLDE